MRNLIAIGEALIDFIPKEKGVKLSEVVNFERHCGGAPANVAATYAYLGGNAKMLTKLGVDAFGDFIIKTLNEKGVDTSIILRTDKANTSLAFVSLDSSGDRDFAFYRKPGSDMLLESKELDKSWFEGNILHFCSVDLVECPMKYAHITAIEYTKKSGGIISFDPNLRFPLWEDKNELKKTVLEFCRYADIIKVSDDEAEFLTGSPDLKTGAKILLDLGAKIVIITRGKEGAFALTNSYDITTRAIVVDKVVDTTGAGDIFIGSFLYYIDKNNISFDNEEGIRVAMNFAGKASALSVQVKGANFDKEKLFEYMEAQWV